MILRGSLSETLVYWGHLTVRIVVIGAGQRIQVVYATLIPRRPGSGLASRDHACGRTDCPACGPWGGVPPDAIFGGIASLADRKVATRTATLSVWRIGSARASTRGIWERLRQDRDCDQCSDRAEGRGMGRGRRGKKLPTGSFRRAATIKRTPDRTTYGNITSYQVVYSAYIPKFRRV